MSSNRAALKVLVFDEHTLFRQFLRQSLEQVDEVHTVRETEDVCEAVAIIQEFVPDVILLDAFRPDSLIRIVELVRQAGAHAKVLILTWHEDPWVVRAALDLGVRGFLSKSITRPELHLAFHSICAGKGQVVLMLAAESITSMMRPEASQAPSNVSRREREVLVLASRALSNAQIGQQLNITEGTVKRHLSNVYAKLGAVSRVDAVNRAASAALIPSAVKPGSPPRMTGHAEPPLRLSA